MKAPLEFTGNDAVEMMHKNQAFCFRKLADHIEKWKMDWEETVEMLRDFADTMEAQAMVVGLRDHL